MEVQYCNNCGKSGHILNQCKMPITSIGMIAFRKKNDKYEFLMICRKETLGYMDFIRGKYSLNNKNYIMNMINQMTLHEKSMLLNNDFRTLWKNIWNEDKTQYKQEYNTSHEKFMMLKEGITINDESYNLDMLIKESNSEWVEPEWGFPKGRRNLHEKDYDCALREFCEETGYNSSQIQNIQNVMPIFELFTGSNYKSYKHKYFLVYMKNNCKSSGFQESEVSNMKWMTIDECLTNIRDYNLEKIQMITKIHECMLKTQFCMM
tara:strand:+ start:2633 stop:3421 length:789 start_codon:yes stop_codon:yes gene_type:complete